MNIWNLILYLLPSFFLYFLPLVHPYMDTSRDVKTSCSRYCLTQTCHVFYLNGLFYTKRCKQCDDYMLHILTEFLLQITFFLISSYPKNYATLSYLMQLLYVMQNKLCYSIYEYYNTTIMKLLQFKINSLFNQK